MIKIGKLWWKFRKSSHNTVMANFYVFLIKTKKSSKPKLFGI